VKFPYCLAGLSVVIPTLARRHILGGKIISGGILADCVMMGVTNTLECDRPFAAASPDYGTVYHHIPEMCTYDGKFSGNLVPGGNFQKFSLIVNITDKNTFYGTRCLSHCLAECN